MAASDTAKLIASLELKDKFSKTLVNANRSLAGFDAKLSQTQGRAFKAGQQIGTGIKNGLKIATVAIGLLGTQVLAGLGQLSKLENATVATNAALLSTKGVSGQTAASIRNLSEKFENLNATMDDKVIQSGANMLLTFTNIRRQGFEPALEAALNLNEAMSGGEEGLQGNIIKVGKALNDPLKGLTALTKSGVTFTAAQKDMITQLVGTGNALKDLGVAHVALTKEQKELVKALGPGTTGLDAAAAAGIKLTDAQKALLTTIADGTGLIKAQEIVLKELGVEFGGRFAAKGKTAEAAIAGIGDAVEDLQKGLAIGLFPTIQKMLPRVRELLTSDAFAKGATDLGNKIAGLFSDKNITEGTNALKGLFQAAKDAAPALQHAAEVTGKVVSTAVGMFRSLPPGLQTLLVAGLAINKLTGGLVTNLAGGLISAVLSSFKGLMTVNAGVVNVVGAGGLPGVAGGGKGKLGAIAGIAGVGVGAAVASEFSDEITGFGVDLRKQIAGENFPTISLSQLEWPFGPKNTPTILPEIFGGNGLLGGRGTTTQPGWMNQLRESFRTFDETNRANRRHDTGGGINGVIQTEIEALRANTTALRMSTEQARSIYAKSATARGIKDDLTTGSTSITSRLKFIGGGKSAGDRLAVANALVTHIERSNKPLYESSKSQARTLKTLTSAQVAFTRAGDTKSARTIGGYIDRLRRKISGKDPVTKVDVSVKSSPIYINGRLFQASVTRHSSVVGHSITGGGSGSNAW